jgi:membrane carboxypeptidase/penicillin-binding protein
MRPIAAAATGGRVAAPVWARMMKRLYEGRTPPKPWAAPPGVVRAVVDSATGLVVAEGCEAAYSYGEIFLRSHVPAQTCPGEYPTYADDDWERDDRDRRREREEWLEGLREEIERRLRERRRWMEEAEDRREEAEQRRREAEKQARKEQRRREKEERERAKEDRRRRERQGR